MAFRPPKKPILTLDANLVQDDLPLEVVPKIFVGSIHSAFNLDMLQAHGITHILNASRLPVTFPKQFTYLSVEIRDKGESNILSCIPTTNIFIEAAIEEGGVLVHCFGGKSRSPAFIAAYLMSSCNLSFDDAYGRIKQARPTVDINAGFECQLRAYAAGNYDVYVAQQLLLRTRIRALYPLKGNEQFINQSDAKASERIASTASKLNRADALHLSGYTKHDDDPDKVLDNQGGHSPENSLLAMSRGISTGTKRSWVEDKARPGSSGGDKAEDSGMDVVITRTMSNDMEESQAIRDLERQQALSMGHTSSSLNLSCDSNSSHSSVNNSMHSIAYRSSSVPDLNVALVAESTGSQPKTPKISKGRVNRGGRSLNADVDTKTPTCRLSRPGANWVRVIPPLRGLEREFKCSWCNIALFSLANVIRVDLDVLPLLDTIKSEEKISESRRNTPRLEALDSPPNSTNIGNSSFHSKPSVTFPEMGPPTPRTLLRTSGVNNNSFSDHSVPMTVQTPRGITPRGDGGFPSLTEHCTPRGALQTTPPTRSSPDVEMDIDDDCADDHASPKHQYTAPLKSSRAGASKGFTFDIPMINLDASRPSSSGGHGGFSGGDYKNKDSPESKSEGFPLASARGSGQGNLTGRSSGGNTSSVLSPTSARSPKVSARHTFSEGSPVLSARKYDPNSSSVSFSSDSKHSAGGGATSLMSKALTNRNTPAAYGTTLPLLHPSNITSRPSSATSTSLFSYNQGGHSSALFDDSPRIQIPAHRANETWSPRDRRPQSAEKRRWLARVNLIREGDVKVAKMAEDDDVASELGYGADKYLYVEYLDWMGKELFRHGNEAGDICCFNCHKVVGCYIWKPSVRLTLNSKLEAPLFKIHKHVVHQTDWVFDATPKSTPRMDDSEGLDMSSGNAH